MTAPKVPTLHYFLLLVTAVLRVTMSDPKLAQSPSDLSDVLEVSGHHKDLPIHNTALLQQQKPLEADDFLLDGEDTQGNDWLTAEYTLDTAKRTAELEKLLKEIRQGVMTVGKNKQKLIESEKLQKSKTSNPSSRFLRIGRNRMDSGKDLPQSPEPSGTLSDFKHWLKKKADSPKSSKGTYKDMADSSQNKSKDERPQVHDSLQTSPRTRRGAYVRFGRWHSLKSPYMRFGRAAPVKNSHNIVLHPGHTPRDRFRRTARHREAVNEKVMRARYLNSMSRLARRSFVRIGRLPSSVFLQRLRFDSRGNRLAGRRSPGFRLSRSGVVRLGKRPESGQ